MAPIPVYSSSPISAAKAQGVTPKTADKINPSPASAPGPAPAPAAPAPTSPTSQKPYPPAQPGAQPSLPVQTGAPPQPHNPYAPTPTQTTQSSSPPAPQPGAAPEPPKANLPPPPRAGESLKPEHLGSSSGPSEDIPPQMSYQAPAAPFPAKSRGTATAIPQPQPQLFGTGEGGVQADPSHPPGYHQDVNASEFNSYQRAAHNAYVSESSSFGDAGADGSIWDQAKKWASAAGEGLAAAEHEVWKKINKE